MEQIRNPGPVQVSSGIKGLFGAFALVGAAVFAWGLMSDPQRTWFSFVQNHFYFMTLAISGIFFSAIHWITGAMWSAPVRRLSEAFTAYLPVVLISFIVLCFGMHHLYIWTHESHVKGDLVLEGKSGYLSTTFFIIRNILVVGVWMWLARKLIGNSLAQDKDHSPKWTEASRKFAPIFFLIFGVTYTMVAFDQIMSLDPHWFSTIFGVYCFAGMMYSMFALICLMTLWMKRAGALKGIVNENHLHDIGKFMFAFTVFWAYIGFSQFMLIWYANQPEETSYFLHRFHGSWMGVSIFLLIGKFMTPFFFLMPRDAKRNETVLMGVAWFMLVAQWIDVLWMVQPQYSLDGPHVGVIEIGVTMLFIGAFGTVVSRFLGKHSVLAVGDPRLAESVFHHHQ